MFEFVRKYKYLNVAILALLIVPFAFFGLEAYTRSMQGAEDVAVVEGVPITQREFSDELQRQQQRLRGILGKNADVSMLDTPESRRALLDSLIAKRVIGDAALKQNVIVPDETLRELIAGTPEFQVGGKFSMAQYESMLRAQGMTTVGYETRLRYDIGTGQLARAVAETAIPGRSVADRLSRLEGEVREVAEVVLAPETYMAGIRVDDAEVRSYYDTHAAEFQSPESVRAEVLVLSAEELGKAEEIRDEELRAVYENRASQYQGDEQRRASHILIQTTGDASEESRQAARKKAEDILAEARKTPARFAELARKHSQDAGSAEKGGDLGLFGRGMMVRPFEDAVFAMKAGETSGIVESEFGFHIIRLVSVQAARGKAFATVRGEIADELRRQKGMRRFNDAAEAFSNMVYEQSESLEPAAKQFKLKVHASDWITRSGSPEITALRNRRLLDALFSSDSIGAKRNTDAIEIGPNVIAAARVVAHRPAARRSFEEVRVDIERMLKRREASKLARLEGSSRLEAVRKGGDSGLKWGSTRKVSRRGTPGMDPEAIRHVMAADVSRLPVFVGVERGDAGYVLYKITKVVAGDAADAQSSGSLARAARQSGLADYEGYIASLRGNATVRINEANLKNKP